MLKPSRVAVAVGITVLLTGLGCSRDPLAGRRSLDLEQALHGHWSSTRELELAPNAVTWDTTDATERWGVELDRYIDAHSEPKVWAEMAGDRSWRTLSQNPDTGVIEIEAWPTAQPGKTVTIALRLDDTRNMLWEKLPSKKGQATVREWAYVNEQSSP